MTRQPPSGGARPRPDAPPACDARAGTPRTYRAEERRRLDALRNAIVADLAAQRRRLDAERDAANGGRHLRRIKRRTWLRALALTAGLDERDRAAARGLARPGRMAADGEVLVDVPADLAARLGAVQLLARVGDRWVATYLRGEPVSPRPAPLPESEQAVSTTTADLHEQHPQRIPNPRDLRRPQ